MPIDAQRLDLLHRRPDARDVGGRDEEQVGRVLERGQRVLVEARRGVDHHVLERLGEERHHLLDLLGRDVVGLGGCVGRAQDVEVVLRVDGEVGLEAGGVERVERAQRVGEREVGTQPERAGDVAELHVEVDDDHLARRDLGQRRVRGWWRSWSCRHRPWGRAPSRRDRGRRRWHRSRRRRTRGDGGWRCRSASSIAARRSAGAMSGAITSRAPARSAILQQLVRRRRRRSRR